MKRKESIIKMNANNNQWPIEIQAYGIIEQEFRHSKGFTLADAANGYTSVSHLSEFENGKTMLATNTFFGILRNIHVEPFEFESKYNQHLHEDNVTLSAYEISEAYTERNIAKLKEILRRIQTTRSAHKDLVSLRLDEIRIMAVIKLIRSDFDIALQDISYLVKYLLNLKGWGQYEITLLGYTAMLISSSDLKKLTDKLIDPTKTDFNLHFIKLTTYRTILNIIDVFAKRKLYPEANLYIQYLKKDNIHDYFTYEKLTLIYTEAMIKFISGNPEALATMKECQKTFTFCNCFNMANILDHEIAMLEKQYKK